MCSEEFLSRAYHANKEVNRQMERLERLRQRTQSATVSYGGQRVDHTRNTSWLQDAINSMMQQERKVDMAVDELVDRKREIASVIDGLRNKNYRRVLTLRYLDFMSWKKISKEMNRSIRCVRTFHDRALKVVDGVLMNKDCV